MCLAAFPSRVLLAAAETGGRDEGLCKGRWLGTFEFLPVV